MTTSSEVSTNEEMFAMDGRTPGFVAQQSHDGRDAGRLEVVDLAHEHGRDVERSRPAGQAAHRIDHHQRRVEVLDQSLHQGQVVLQPAGGRPLAVEVQQPPIHPASQVQPD